MNRLLLILPLILAATAGCDDDDGGPAPTATVAPSATAVATATASPTATSVPTATPDEAAHREVEIGSTGDGSGALAASFEFDRAIVLFFNSCLGGDGEECTGGTRIYSAPNPGFVPHGHDHEETGAVLSHDGEPHDDLFELVDGTMVSLEIVAIDAGLSITIDGQRLDEPGQTAALGHAPDFHGDAETFLALAGDSTESELHLSFQLHTTSAIYQSSADYQLRFVAADDDRQHEDEGDHSHE